MKRLWIGIKSFFACGFSASSYIVDGMPSDKQSYWKNQCGFAEAAPNLVDAFDAYYKEPTYHHLKDILVEWTKVWPQRAAKVTAMFGMGLGVLGLLIGLSVSALCLIF